MLTKPNSRALLSVVLIVGVVLLAALWQQRFDVQRLQSENARLTKQNKLFHQIMMQAGAGSGQLAAMASAAPDTTAQVTGSAQKPNPLLGGKAEVQQIAAGLLATMEFNLDNSDPQEVVALTIRMPTNSTARILDLVSLNAAEYTNSFKRVSKDGKFAIFQGTPKDMKPIKLNLSVTGPAVVDVRGTRGIAPFKLAITPAGATVFGD